MVQYFKLKNIFRPKNSYLMYFIFHPQKIIIIADNIKLSGK